MRKKIVSKVFSIVSVTLCFTLFFNVCAFATEVAPASIIENIEINEVRGILKGEEKTLTAEIDGRNSPNALTKWESSDEDAVSCTISGKIKGLKSHNYSDITCKAILGDAQDTLRVYCVEPLVKKVTCYAKGYFYKVYSQPRSGASYTPQFNISFILKPILDAISLLLSVPNVYPQTSSNDFLKRFNITVLGRYGRYCYVEYKEGKFGYIDYTDLDEEINGFLYLPYNDVDVWGNGKSYPNKIVNLTKFDGVKWTVGDKEIIDFNETTGQITGKKPGQTTLTATKNGISEVIYIHSLYQWIQSWTGKALRETCVYYATGNKYTKTATKLAVDDDFVVLGDTGGDDGWAYGYFETGSKKEWGYVPISHISTKGTVSQYNGLDWLWPVITPSGEKPATYISSPYGWRDTKPQRHQGIDITTGTAGEIAGYDVVSVFEGTVVFVCKEEGYDWGYCVAVRSKEVDPVSGMQYVAVYMHLMNEPKLLSGQKVKKGTIIGNVGNTSTLGSDMGYHLHFEFNNQNSSIGFTSDGGQIIGEGRKSYDYLINPIFLYIDKYEIGEITYNQTSESEKRYKKTFWYGNGSVLKEAR